MMKKLKVVDSKTKKQYYTLYLPIKARVAIDIDISGNGLLDKMKAQNQILYNIVLKPYFYVLTLSK